jgi:hypothetical protein
VADAAKAGRWLGYVDFERVHDNRNDPPELIARETICKPVADCRTAAYAPDDDFDLKVSVGRFTARQPWQIAIFGEKSSLKGPLLPLCRDYSADLYICSGEISDTLIYDIAKSAAADGRPLLMLTLSDFDPAGRQMPVSIAWKLQAFRVLKFGNLHFRVLPVALTEEQAVEFNLPSTPLKPTEGRADRWREEFGREQTEIDALLALHPGVLQNFVREAIASYFDDTLRNRLYDAREAWLEEAHEAVNQAIVADDDDEAGSYQTCAREAAENLEDAIQELDAIGQRIIDDGILPPIAVPQAEIDEPDVSNVLVSSTWSHAEIARQLKARKAHGSGNDDAEAA